ncbi:glycosyltransferase family 4 protein [Pseudarthrobacter sp902506025]|uniref:glycosyltransferase family 4 protein n=1 Tax=Pseudarthrobacter sp. 902506025 TaxID=3155291 RepID=UPI0034505FFB
MNYDFLHFSEGLGYKALQKKEFSFSICERRNFHHAVYEQEIEVLENYPINGRPDPIGDILNFEYERSNFILVYSEAAKSSFVERGYDPDKVRVTPIGIGPQLPRKAMRRNATSLLYVGRSDAFKGLDVAVAAVKLLGHPFRLTVAGVMSPEVKSWLSAQKAVDYVGVLSKRELRDAYSSHGAIILPSIESFGLAPAEAVYHGLPLVCSDQTGIAEYLPESHKRIVFGRDPQAWASAVLEVCGRPGSIDPAASAAIDSAFAALSWRSAAEKLRLLYDSAIY